MFMPAGTHQNNKKVNNTPYPTTGETARDSCRKRIYDVLIDATEKTRGEWTANLEDELYNLSGSTVNKDYRDQARKLIEIIKSKKSAYFKDLEANNSKPEVKELFDSAIVKKDSKSKSPAIPGIKNPFGAPVSPPIERKIPNIPVVQPIVKNETKQENAEPIKTQENLPKIDEKPQQVLDQKIDQIPKIEPTQQKLTEKKSESLNEKSEKTIPKIPENQIPESKIIEKVIENPIPQPVEKIEQQRKISENNNKSAKVPEKQEIHENKPQKTEKINEKSTKKQTEVIQKYNSELDETRKKMQESLARMLEEAEELNSQPIPSDDSCSEPENSESLSGSNTPIENQPSGANSNPIPTPNASDFIANEKSTKPIVESGPLLLPINQKNIASEIHDESGNSPVKTEDIESIPEIAHHGAKSVISTVTRYDDWDSLQTAYQKKKEELEDCKHKLEASETELNYCIFCIGK